MNVWLHSIHMERLRVAHFLYKLIELAPLHFRKQVLVAFFILGYNHEEAIEKRGDDAIMQKKSCVGKAMIVLGAAMAFCACCLSLYGCNGEKGREMVPAHQEGGSAEETAHAVNFDHTLDGYQPLKQEYNFYFTYKVVHPWWDAVALGIEDAAEQYGKLGIAINYEYLAPNEASASDQVQRLLDAAGRGFDVLGVDVADVEVLTPVINKLIGQGQKVMTFSSSDAAKEDGCDRIAYVGNTHNRKDGAALTEALCQKLDYQGKVAILVGTEGAPCHEERAIGAREVLARYPNMEVAEIAYDGDSVEKSYQLAQGFLAAHKDLAGIICCNMSNPVGAARAVAEAGLEGEVAIVGMDHDQEALHYLKDGTIYALGVQDCYSIGFDTVQVAVKIADGLLPGEAYLEKTEEATTVIYQDGAAAMLQILYGEIEEGMGEHE